jgi:hypothetical protein
LSKVLTCCRLINTRCKRAGIEISCAFINNSLRRLRERASRGLPRLR